MSREISIEKVFTQVIRFLNKLKIMLFIEPYFVCKCSCKSQSLPRILYLIAYVTLFYLYILAFYKLQVTHFRYSVFFLLMTVCILDCKYCDLKPETQL
jgi:hypothetical protein